MKYQKIGRQSLWRGIWESSVFTMALVLVLIFSLVKMIREIKVRYDINQEIADLKVQRAKLEGQKADLENLLSYLQTDTYIEKEARLKLNLGKPGEKQINLSDNGPVERAVTNQDNNASNMRKWFDYFFK